MNTIMDYLLRNYDRVNVEQKKKARVYFYLVGIMLVHSIIVLIMTLLVDYSTTELLYAFLSFLIYGLLGALLYNTKIQYTLYLFALYAIARSVYLISMGDYLIFISFLSIMLLFLGVYRINKTQYYVLLGLPVVLTIYSIFYAINNFGYEGVELFSLIESLFYLFVVFAFVYLFNTILEQEIKRSKRLHEQSTLGLLMKAHQRRERDKIKDMHIVDNRTTVLIVGIDQYQKVNQEEGIEVGDQLLKEVITLIRNKIRIDDYIIRWNYEDFLVILNFTPISNASIVAEKIRKIVEQTKFASLKKKITVSIACASSGETMHETIEKAESLLSKIKPLKENHVELDIPS